MSFDPIVAAFDRLAELGGHVPLVATLSRTDSRAEIAAWSRFVEVSLESSGPPRGAYVLMTCVNGAGFLAALLGIRRAGRVAVLADWTSPPSERERIAAAIGITHEVSCDEVAPRRASSFRIAPLGGVARDPAPGVDYVKLTSGSRGEPVGVAVAAEALAADDDQLVASMGLRADDRFVAAIPWSHSYALSSLVMPALRRGSLLVIPEDGGPWSPIEAARVLEATVFPTVPFYLHTIVSLAEPPAWPAALRTVISAGAPLRPETAARFREAYDRSVHVFYGASECGGICYDREGGAALRGTVGTPVEGVTIVISSEGDGDGGAVEVRSAATGLRRVPDADDRLNDGWFRSADLAAWSTRGELRLLGRSDTLINTAGKKVHPAEVEAVLSAMPGVREAVVLGVTVSGSARELVRAVIACDQAVTSYASVAAWCRARLATHKVPRSVILVEEIPRTTRGKIDRAALAGPAPSRIRE